MQFLCLFCLYYRILKPWPLWVFQLPCFPLMLLQIVSCSLLPFEQAASFLFPPTQAGILNNSTNTLSTLLSSLLALVRKHQRYNQFTKQLVFSFSVKSKTNCFIFFLTNPFWLWKMVVACGTSPTLSGCPCGTWLLVQMRCQSSGAFRDYRSKEDGTKKAVALSTVTAEPPQCAALCSAIMLYCRLYMLLCLVIHPWITKYNHKVFKVIWFAFSFQEVSEFHNSNSNSVRVLHPVVYACTAVLLLCVFTIVITHIIHHRYCIADRVHVAASANSAILLIVSFAFLAQFTYQEKVGTHSWIPVSTSPWQQHSMQGA